MGRVCFNDPYHVCPLSGGLVIDCTLSEMQSHLSSQVHNLQYMYTVPPPSDCTCHLPSLLFAPDQLHMSFTANLLLADLTYAQKSQGLSPGTALILKEL